MDSHVSPRTRPLYRATQAVWYLLGLLEVILAFRFGLKLLGANPAAGFTSFIYRISAPFAEPFLDVFRISRVAGAVFEWTTLLAMLVYLLLAEGIVDLLLMGRDVSTPEAAAKLRKEEDKS